MRKGNDTSVQYFPNRMTVHLNVFGTLMKDGIGSNLNGTSVVSMERSRLGLNTTNLSKEITKLENLRTRSRHCTVFRFSRRFGDAILFLTLPRYQRVTKKHAPNLLQIIAYQGILLNLHHCKPQVEEESHGERIGHDEKIPEDIE